MTGLIKVIPYKAVEELSVRGPEGDLLGFNQASEAKEQDRDKVESGSWIEAYHYGKDSFFFGFLFCFYQ